MEDKTEGLVDDLITGWAALINDAEKEIAADATDAEHTGERTYLWEYDVFVDLNTARATIDALTALQAENERLRARVQELGGEGHAYRKGQLAGYEVAKARAEKAEAERDAWKANAEELAEACRQAKIQSRRAFNLTENFHAVLGAVTAAVDPVLTAHAKLKGDA